MEVKISNRKTYNKSLKLVFVVLLASVLFLLVNYSIWDNANASVINDSHGGQNFRGHHIGGTKYEFSEEQGNFRTVVLNNKNIVSGDEVTLQSKDNVTADWDLQLSGGYIDWIPTRIEGEDEITLRPEAFDDYEYGTDDEHDRWEWRDLHFVLAEGLCDDNGVSMPFRDNYRLGVLYGKKSPDSSLDDNGLELYFRIRCIDAQLSRGFDPDWMDKYYYTDDSFEDCYDRKDCGAGLFDLGHKDDTFKEALDQVNYAMKARDDSDFRYDNIIDAIKDGRIELELYKVICDRDA